MAFLDCIRDAEARGEISREDADDLRLRYQGFHAATGSASAARDRLQEELAREGAQQRRQQAMMIVARDRIIDDISKYRAPNGDKDMRAAMYSLFEDFGFAGYSNARFVGESYMGVIHAKMAEFLETFRRKTLTKNGSLIGGRMNKPLLEDVRKAAYGETTSPEAQALYESFAESAEMMRQAFNAAGGLIPKREDWGMPQSHNADAVIRAGKGKTPQDARTNWVNFINPLLNWEKMFDPLTGEFYPPNLPESRKNAILGHVWETIVTDGHINRTPNMQRFGTGSVANSRLDHRFLAFKDAESSAKYSREFSNGDVFTQMMSHLHEMAKDVALMERFGPNPSAMVEYLKNVLDHEAAQLMTGKPNSLGSLDPVKAKAKINSAKHTLDAFYEQYRGVNSAQGTLALAGTILRNWEISALMGSAVIPDVTMNWFVQGMMRHIGGMPAAKVLPEILRGFTESSHAEILRAALDIENGMFSLGTGARQMGALAKVANWTRWLPDRTVQLTGMVAHNEASKQAFNRGMMAELADLHGTAWGALPERVRNKMAGYGINDRDWQIIQLAQLYDPAFGSAQWLRWKEVNDLGVTRPFDVLRLANRGDLLGNAGLDPDSADIAKSIAFNTAIKLLTYMNGEREAAIPQRSWRAGAALIGTSDPNTWWGQLRQSAGLFKNFIGAFSLIQAQVAQRELAANRYKGAAYIAAMVTGLTVTGMLSLQLKQLLSGKDALPMEPNTRQGAITWLRAFATSGSLGIFGDFLASEFSSFGLGPLETLAGPVAAIPLGALTGAVKLMQNVTAKKPKKEPWGRLLASNLVSFIRYNTPVASTAWPVRAAYQRLLMDNLQYMADPNAHQKMRQNEIKMQRETGQQFWWPPGHEMPERMPRMTHGR